MSAARSTPRVTRPPASRASLVLLTAATLSGTAGLASPLTGQQAHSGRVELNGVNYYYEIHGAGDPLLLLHRGVGSIDRFRPILPALAAGRQVIAVDLHGHGRTPLGRRPIDLVDMGDDLAALLGQLGYQQADVMGYSLGGGVA